jgi:hypothetical protein
MVAISMTFEPPSPTAARSPLSQGRGLYSPSFWPSPPGRRWPAAGVFTRRSGPGEGLLDQDTNTPHQSDLHNIVRTSIMVFVS